MIGCIPSVAAMPLIAPMEIPDPVAVQAMQDMAHEETRTIGQVFEEAGRREGVSTEWRSFLSSSGYGQAFTDSTRSVDLIVAAQVSRALPPKTAASWKPCSMKAAARVLLCRISSRSRSRSSGC